MSCWAGGETMLMGLQGWTFFLLILCSESTYLDLDSALTSQGWRTEAEIRRMSEGDKRNTIIAELNEVTGLSIGQLGGKSNPELLELIADREEERSDAVDLNLPEYECKTVGGITRNKLCIFPFKNPYNGAKHYACTHDHGMPAWCATRVDNYGYMMEQHMGFCGSNCPKEEHATCFASLSTTHKSTWGTKYKKKERRTCVFPFTWNGKNYTECAPWPRGDDIYPKDQSTPICATSVDEKGVLVDRGYCQADCPGAGPAKKAVKAVGGPGIGSRCVFPFHAEKVWNVDCRPKDGDRYCATELTEHGSMQKDQYGYCAGNDTTKCITVGGAKWGQACRFPFKSPWSNKLHYGCTTDVLEENKGSKVTYPSAPWCATNTDAQDKMKSNEWGFCSQSCPQEEYNYCYADVGSWLSQLKKCIFPFTFLGQQYFQCMSHKGELKCATKVDESGAAREGDLFKCTEPRECGDSSKVNGQPLSVGYQTIASYTNSGSKCLKVDFEYSTGVEDTTTSNWNVEASVAGGFSGFGVEFEASVTAGGGADSSSSSSGATTHSLSYEVAPYSRVTIKQLVATAGSFKAHSFKIKLEEINLKTNKAITGSINGQKDENGTVIDSLIPCGKFSAAADDDDDDDGDDGGDDDDEEDDEDEDEEEEEEEEEECSDENDNEKEKKDCKRKSKEEDDEDDEEKKKNGKSSETTESEESGERTTTTRRTTTKKSKRG